MGHVQLNNIEEPTHAMKEAFRTLKTNIQFCGSDIKTIVFTSSAPDEGKSTVVFNLAESLAESGKRVLIIDADMRKSVLINRLGAVNTDGGKIYGLSHLITGQKKASEVIYATNRSKVFMIFAGPSVPNPTELLESNYFKDLLSVCRNGFDYVLIDCPPIGAAIDAAVVARNCDGAILVVGQGMVPSRVIQSVKNQLANSGVHILGAVLNKVKKSNSRYGYGYYGKYYGGYYGDYYGNESEDSKH